MKEWKRIVCLALVLIFCVCSYSSYLPAFALDSSTTGDIVNTGFENGQYKAFNTNSSLPFTYTSDPALRISGKSSMRIDNAGGWNWFLHGAPDRFALPAMQGTVVELSFKYRYVSDATKPNRIWFCIKNDSGSYLPNAAVEWLDDTKTFKNDEGSNFSVTKNGAVYTASFKVPLDGNAGWYPELGIADAGSVIVDDISYKYTYNESFDAPSGFLLAPSAANKIVSGGINGNSLKVTSAGFSSALTNDKAKCTLPRVKGAVVNVSFKHQYEGTPPTNLYIVAHNSGSPTQYFDPSATEWNTAVYKDNNGGATLTENAGVYTISKSFTFDGGSGYYIDVGINGSGVVYFDDYSLSAAITEDFESAYFTESLLNTSSNMNYQYARGANAISGSQSLIVTNPNKNGGDYILRLDKSQYSFPSDTGKNVHISFKYKYPDAADKPHNLSFVLHDTAGHFYDQTAFEWLADESGPQRPSPFAAVTNQGGYYQFDSTFAMNGTSGYIFELGMWSGGTIEIDDFKVTVTEIAANLPDRMKEGFERADLTADDYYFAQPAANVSHTLFSESALAGTKSLLIDNANDAMTTALAGNAAKYAFKPNTKYTVYFKYKLQATNQPDQLAFQVVKDGTETQAPGTGITWAKDGTVLSSSFGPVSSQIAKDAGGYSTAQFTFTTNGVANYEPVLKTTKGSVVVDDFTVVEGSIVTDGTAGTLMYGEDFEGTDLVKTAFVPLGASSADTITSGSPISGSHSVYQNKPVTPGSFNNLMKTDATLLKLTPNTLYTVYFQYKPIHMPDGTSLAVQAENESGSQFKYMRFTSSDVGETACEDGTGWKLYDKSTDYVKNMGGGIVNVKFSFVTGSEANWHIKFYNAGGGEYAIDNLSVYQGLNPSDTFTAKKDILNTTVTKVAFENFEDGTFGKFKKETSGAVSFTQDDVLNGTYTVKGSSSAEWYEYMHSDTSKLPLKANTMYTLTYRYKVVSSTADSVFTFIAKPLDSSAPVSTQIWGGFKADGSMDASWNSGIKDLKSKTLGDGTREMYISFTTADRTDYYLALGIHNGGAILVDDVGLYEGYCEDTGLAAADPKPLTEQTLASENFSGDPYTALFVPAGVSGTGKSSGRIIDNGFDGQGILGESPESWWEYLYSNPDRIKLNKNTTYTVSCTVQMLTAPANDGFITFLCKTPDAPAGQGGTADRYLGIKADGTVEPSFANGIDNYKVTKLADSKYQISVTFTTRNYERWQLAFGVHNLDPLGTNARLLVDNVAISALQGTAPILLPANNNVTKVAFEDFESGTFGKFQKETSGAISYTKSDVLNGSYTVKGSSAVEWYEYIHSNTERLPLKANTLYTLTYRYKVVASTPDSVFTFIAKPLDSKAPVDTQIWGGFKADGSMDNSWKSGIKSMVGKTLSDGTKEMYISFKTGDRTDYYLALGIRNGGTILVDDMGLYEGFCRSTGLAAADPKPLTEQTLATEDFSGDPDTALFIPAGVSGTGKSSGKLIDNGFHGKGVLGNSPEAWWEFLYSNPDRIKLHRNTTYTINYTVQVLTAPANNGFFTFLCKSPDAPKGQEGKADRYLGIKANGTVDPSFVNGIDNYKITALADSKYQISITFTTGDYDNWRLAFGIHNLDPLGTNAKAIIDDISLTALAGTPAVVLPINTTFAGKTVDHGTPTGQAVLENQFTNSGADVTRQTTDVSTRWKLNELLSASVKGFDTTKLILILSGSVVALAALGYVAFTALKKRKKLKSAAEKEDQ